MGDERAIEEFVLKYYPQILKYCRGHMDDYGYAEDMTQETFVRFFRNLDRYQDYGKMANYLYVIAGNLCRDYYRKKGRIAREVLVEASMAVLKGEASGDAGRDMKNPDLRMDVRFALESLPEELREVAVLYFLQERKQKDVARILGISVPLVKYRIRKIREIFMAYFGKEDV